MPEYPRARAAADELARAALTIAAASSHTALQGKQPREAATAPEGGGPDHAEAPDSLPWHPPAGMVDAHPPHRHGRYSRYTAYPQRDRPLLHVPRLRAGAGITCQRPPGGPM